MSTRIEELIGALRWSQPQMAGYLGLTQPAVSNMARGQRESGPVKRLLDLKAREIGRDDLTADQFSARSPEAAE